jgi:hypothetical protein
MTSIDNIRRDLEYEDMMLYALTSNNDYLGTDLIKLLEKCFYKKFQKLFPIPPRDWLNKNLKNDIKF